MESILGVVLAGVLYAVLPLKVLFLAVGACFIASGISEMLIRYDHTPSAEPITLRLAVSDMREGILYLKGQKAIMAIIGAALFINFFFTPSYAPNIHKPEHKCLITSPLSPSITMERSSIWRGQQASL